MKNFHIGWVFIAAILFSACSGGGLIGNPYLDNQGHLAPLTDSIRQLADKGYVQIDSSHAGNPLIQTVMVRYEPTFAQKVQITKKTGVFDWAIVLIVIAWVLIIYGIIYSSNAGKFAGAAAILFIVAICLHFGAFSLINWATTKEIPMSKMMYDFLQSTPGALKQYTDQLLLQ